MLPLAFWALVLHMGFPCHERQFKLNLPLRRCLILQENSFFSISWKSITVLFLTTMENDPFHKRQNQEFGSILVQLYHQILEWTPAPLWISTGNNTFFFTARLLLYLGHRNQSGPSLPWSTGLVQWISIAKRHFTNVLLSGDGRFCMTYLFSQATKSSTGLVCTNRTE